MQDLLIQVVFGWPAIVVALGLCTAGIIWKKAFLVVIGAVVFTPFSLYFSGYPFARGAIFLPFFLLVSAYAVHRKKTLLASLLLIPAVLVSLWLATIVLSQ